MPAARIETLDRLSAGEQAGVVDLVDAAAAQDGLAPLSEHVMLHLRLGGDSPARHLLAYAADGALAAYAHLDPTDEVEGSSAELVVHPGTRRNGIGREVIHRLEQAAPDGRLRLWSHGRLPPAQALAASLGYRSARELWQMRRSLLAPLPAVSLPDGYALRAFAPGSDDERWLALNAAAFAHHPEQGAWSAEDLRLRMAEPWFDPDGFLVLEGPSGDMAGFHWTKVHGGLHRTTAGEDHAHDPIGEVYVVAVSPAHQGRGLGRQLTVAGLRHLRSRRLTQAMLYVDADNLPAIGTYTSLGFTRWDVDTMFARPRP